jgi:hypothetical protein
MVSETMAFTLGAVGMTAIVGVGICWLAAVVERRQQRAGSQWRQSSGYGPLCMCCGRRCFAYREVFVDGVFVWAGHMATCQASRMPPEAD